MNFVILRYEELGSTNTEAIEQAKRGADEGLCIVARRQTAGRGRQGRSWQSPADSGLYFSIVLRPQIDVKFFPLLTLMSAVAVTDTLKYAFSLTSDIKWVNDVHVSGKKICGVLAEIAETEKGVAVIVGIGINLRSDNFPFEIADTATSVEREIGKTAKMDSLLPALTGNLDRFYTLLHSDNGIEDIKNEWAKRSSYHTGKDVRVVMPNETIVGTTCGLEETGALRVKQPDGEIRIVHAGDVENLRAV